MLTANRQERGYICDTEYRRCYWVRQMRFSSFCRNRHRYRTSSQSRINNIGDQLAEGNLSRLDDVGGGGGGKGESVADGHRRARRGWAEQGRDSMHCRKVSLKSQKVRIFIPYFFIPVS